MIKQCVIDEEICRNAAKAEIIRRYYNILCDNKQQICDEKAVERTKALMDKLDLSLDDRKVARIANEKAIEKGTGVLAIQLDEGKVITGKETRILSCASAAFLNAIKDITKIPDDEYLLSPTVLNGIYHMKQKTSYNTSYFLNLPEVLIVLSICAVTNPIIEKAINELRKTEKLRCAL